MEMALGELRGRSPEHSDGVSENTLSPVPVAATQVFHLGEDPLCAPSPHVSTFRSCYC